MKKSIKLFCFFIFILVLIIVPEKQAETFGIFSLLPPVVAIFFALYTREVLSSLFIAILSGGIISKKYNILEEFIIPSVASENFALILIVYLWALGGLIGVWTKTGGALTFAKWASDKIVKGPKSAKFFCWLMGMVFHQGGTISTVLTGTTVRSVTDKYLVSHEELSYIVDSTSLPSATIIPFNVWPFYISGLVIGTIPLFQSKMDGVHFFFSSVLFNFYAIFAVITTLLFSLEVLPWYPGKKMKEAIKRSRSGLGLNSKNAKPLLSEQLSKVDIPKNYNSGLLDFFLPVLSLIGIIIIPFFISFFILGEKESPILLVSEAFIGAVLIAMIFALLKGMPLSDLVDGFIDGCKGVAIGGIILALAISLKEVTVALGTASYVASLIGTSISPLMLPPLLMILCMLIAFSTGTSWGTYAVIFPIAMPLAWTILPDPFFIKLCFGAIVGGSVFGDQCSPISDTTILSSMASSCDLIDHVTTQLPLALFAASISIIFYILIGVMI